MQNGPFRNLSFLKEKPENNLPQLPIWPAGPFLNSTRPVSAFWPPPYFRMLCCSLYFYFTTITIFVNVFAKNFSVNFIYSCASLLIGGELMRFTTDTFLPDYAAQQGVVHLLKNRTAHFGFGCTSRKLCDRLSITVLRLGISHTQRDSHSLFQVCQLGFSNATTKLSKFFLSKPRQSSMPGGKNVKLKMTNSIADLLSSSFYANAVNPSLDQGLVALLLHNGCDYFDIIRLLSSFMPVDCSIQDIETLQSFVPESRRLAHLGLSEIRAMIPRWTGTKYHTGPINRVVEDIQQKCRARQLGMFTYHSNLNPRNKKSVDDPYILMISPQKLLFLDLNRRQTFTYSYCEEETNDVQAGNL